MLTGMFHEVSTSMLLALFSSAASLACQVVLAVQTLLERRPSLQPKAFISWGRRARLDRWRLLACLDANVSSLEVA